jgi:putative FmdB family regulatory protein
MPILTYKCLECGKEFAKIVFKPEDAPKTCLVCEGTELEVGGPAFDANTRSLGSLMCESCDTCDITSSCSSGSCI